MVIKNEQKNINYKETIFFFEITKSSYYYLDNYFLRNLKFLLKRKYISNEQYGFTLIELIIVLVIIGILSAIAIPSFKTISIRAKQVEAAILINSYIKAAQFYYAEFGPYPRYSRDLEHYVVVNACRVADPARCKVMLPYSPGGSAWTSQSGLYTIRMQSYGYRTFIYAVAAGNFATTGLPVVGCYNSQENTSKIHILNTQIPYLNPYGHSC